MARIALTQSIADFCAEHMVSSENRARLEAVAENVCDLVADEDELEKRLRLSAWRPLPRMKFSRLVGEVRAASAARAGSSTGPSQRRGGGISAQGAGDVGRDRGVCIRDDVAGADARRAGADARRGTTGARAGAGAARRAGGARDAAPRADRARNVRRFGIAS